MYWNIALADGGLSRWGWAQNSLVSVDPTTATYRLNHECHLLRHVSGFVEVGARVIPTASLTGFENQIAFLNPDGTRVIVAHNDSADAQHVSYCVGGDQFEAALPRGLLHHVHVCG